MKKKENPILQCLPLAGENETLTHFHAAVAPVISAVLKAVQAPGWQHLWDGISPQDQVMFSLVQNNLPVQHCLSNNTQRRESLFSGCAVQDGDNVGATRGWAPSRNLCLDLSPWRHAWDMWSSDGCKDVAVVACPGTKPPWPANDDALFIPAFS